MRFASRHVEVKLSGVEASSPISTLNLCSHSTRSSTNPTESSPTTVRSPSSRPISSSAISTNRSLTTIPLSAEIKSSRICFFSFPDDFWRLKLKIDELNAAFVKHDEQEKSECVKRGAQ